MDNNQILLTIGLIVKNEEKVLDKCLSSLKPIMDAVSCELIITDTGSSDKTLEIARKYTDNILHFEWCADFAKARNTGWFAAKGEWFMYIDADEYFISTKEIIAFFTGNDKKNYHTLAMSIRSLTANGLYANSKSFRAVKRLDPEKAFVGEIHECLQGTYPIYHLPVIIEHTGYDFSDVEFRKAKHARNLPILLKMLKEEPDSPVVYIELYYEFDSEGEVEKAIKYAKMGEEVEKKVHKKNHSVFFTSCQMRSLIDENKYFESLSIGEELLRKKPKDEVAMVDVYAMLTIIYTKMQLYKKAAETSDIYFRYLKAYLNNELPMSLNANVVVYYSSEFNIERIHFYTAISFYNLENYTFSLMQIEKINIFEASGLEYDSYLLLLRLAKKINQPDIFLKEYKKIAEKKFEKTYYNCFVNACETFLSDSETDSKENNEFFMDSFCNVKEESNYLAYSKLKKYFVIKNTDKIIEMLRLFDSDPNKISNEYYELIYIAYKTNFSLRNIFSKLNAETISAFVEAVANKYKDELLDMNEYFNKDSFNDSLEYMLWSITLREKYLVSDKYMPKDDNIGVFYTYINDLYVFATNFYNIDFFCEENIHLLPPIYRFAYYAYNAFLNRDNGNDLIYIKNLKYALKTYPQTKRIIDFLLKACEDKIAKVDNAKKEFDNFAQKLLSEAKKHIESNNMDTAKEIIGGLEKLIPDNSELLKLKEKIK